MDVRLPDGTVIQNVPEGTTKAQLMERLKANGVDTSSFESAPVKPSRQAIYEDTVKKRGWGSGAGQATYNLGGAVTDATGSPLAGAATKFLADAVPSFLTMSRGPLTAEQTSHNAMVGQRSDVLSKGRDLGLKVPPSTVNPSMTNRVVESVGGKAATAQKASEVNQDVAYAVAQREAGLTPAEPIAVDTLKAARERIAQPYRDIAAMQPTGPLAHPPFKSPEQTLKEISESRKTAKDLWNFYNKSGRPSIRDKALEASAKADELEQTLEAYATQAGKPELVEKLRAARVALAKNHTVERAMRGSSFDPSALSRLESRGKTPLDGDLETLMQMYRDFPKAMNAPQVGGSVGVNQLMPWLGGAGGGALGAVLGGPTGAGLGAPAGVILGQTLPPMARSLALSPMYQSLMANYSPMTNSLALPGLLANPATAGALYPR